MGENPSSIRITSISHFTSENPLNPLIQQEPLLCIDNYLFF
jgi:hypothetical protein